MNKIKKKKENYDLEKLINKYAESKILKKNIQSKNFIRNLFGKFGVDDIPTEKSNVRFIIMDSDDVNINNANEIRFLLCRIASTKLWVIPKVKIYTSLQDAKLGKFSEKIIAKGQKYFEYFYDIRFVSCCENPIYEINNNICVILGPGEWKGEPKLPRPPIYPHFDALQWFDPKKAVYDVAYRNSFNIGDETFKIIKLILMKANYLKIE